MNVNYQTRYQMTVDCESDYGGRTNSYQGISEGLPRLLDTFDDYKIKSICFISTEILEEWPLVIRDIQSRGHKIGSHGHFHFRYRDSWRAQQDMHLSRAFIQSNGGISPIPYRAPWFNYEVPMERYSYKFGHASVLKLAWGFPKDMSKVSIFYIHPFDIVMPKTKAPNLFCKLLYSRPKQVRIKLEELCMRYT